MRLLGCLLGCLVACLLAYLLGFFVGRGFRTLRVRWVEAGLALVAVRYPGPLHVVLQSFEGKHELQFLHLVQHPQWIEIRPVHWLVHLRAATVEKIIQRRNEPLHSLSFFLYIYIYLSIYLFL